MYFAKKKGSTHNKGPSQHNLVWAFQILKAGQRDRGIAAIQVIAYIS
jgi:hypothetical protein